jgi:hypothetical protein
LLLPTQSDTDLVSLQIPKSATADGLTFHAPICRFSASHAAVEYRQEIAKRATAASGPSATQHTCGKCRQTPLSTTSCLEMLRNFSLSHRKRRATPVRRQTSANLIAYRAFLQQRQRRCSWALSRAKKAFRKRMQPATDTCYSYQEAVATISEPRPPAAPTPTSARGSSASAEGSTFVAPSIRYYDSVSSLCTRLRRHERSR